MARVELGGSGAGRCLIAHLGGRRDVVSVDSGVRAVGANAAVTATTRRDVGGRSAPEVLAGPAESASSGPPPSPASPPERAAPAARRPRDIPREFGAGAHVEQVWLRAASLRPGCPLIAVSSADGGVGRSTLVAALGGLLALACPDPVVAVDVTGRPWGGLGTRVGHVRPATVWDAVQRVHDLRAPGDADDMVQRGPTGLHAIVGEVELRSDRRPPTPGEWYPLLGQLRALYPLALLDCPQADSSAVWRTLQWAAAPVLVARASADSVQHTMRLIAHLRSAGLSRVADEAVVVVMATSPAPAREVRAAERQALDVGTRLVRVPYDPVLARPEPVDPRALGKAVRSALTEVAAAVLQRCPADPQAAQALMERP